VVLDIVLENLRIFEECHMKKKWLAIGIILLFVGTSILPVTAKPILSTAYTVPHPGNFFGLNSNIILSWDANETKEPLIPRGVTRTIALNVLFGVTWGVFGHLIHYLVRYKQVTIQVSVIDRPEWSYATLSQGTLVCNIPPNENDYSMLQTSLTVSVDEDAPAFEVFPVTIQATVESLHGLFGLFTLMQGITRVENVTFNVGYKPLIQPQFPETNVIEAPPLVQVELPIGITNLGNGRTIVANEVMDYPDGWIVSIPDQLIVDVDEYKEMNLSIVAAEDFSGVETITVSFTPHSFDNYSLVGQTTYATFLAFYNPP
jgi:hypothetical protein